MDSEKSVKKKNVKGELKSKTVMFCNTFFRKPNISKVEIR